MECKSLGNLGLRVREIYIETLTVSRETKENTSYKILDKFEVAHGYFIDTVDVFSTCVL